MKSSPDRLDAALRRLSALAAVGIALAVFWRTAYPTITWWDSSNYSTAAATLGITSSPGSLLLTLLGWPLTRLPLGMTPAYVLNLFAGILAAVTVGLVYAVALRVLRNSGYSGHGASAIGAAGGALTFAFSVTLWEHAVKFTPYVLTALFTGLILLTMLRWWEVADEPNAWRWLALLTFLFGLDFSVHRTNALLLPGALAWILVRHPRTALRPKAWIGGAAGMAAGLAVHLLVIPIAATTQSPLNMFEPSNWTRFWDYVSLAQSGGGFLINLWPRNADLWSVQIGDFFRVLGDNFFNRSTSVWILGWLPAVAAMLGLLMIWRKNRQLGLAFTLVLLLHAAMTVVYFNIPANYFRPLDRHYLPVFVTLGVLMASGLGMTAQEVRYKARGGRLVAIVAASLVILPAAQLTANWRSHDASKRYFTRDYAANALASLPPNAIYFTVGDNDTFPVIYLQSVEGFRPDVRIVNLSLANTAWYIDQLAARDSTFPVTRGADGRRRARAATDSTVVIPIRSTAQQLGLPVDASIPTSISLRPRPLFGTDATPADLVLLDIVLTNAWRAPLAFAITGTSAGMAYLERYGRLEGLHWRIVPVEGFGANRDTLRENLLELYEYRGYADPSIMIDDTTRTMGLQYLIAFTALLDADKASGETGLCRAAAQKLLGVLPPDRVLVPGNDKAQIEARCSS